MNSDHKPKTSRSAIADKPRCNVGSLWQLARMLSTGWNQRWPKHSRN